MNFLQAPAVRDLETFTSMPAQYRRTDVRSAWADANRGGAPDRLLPRRAGVRRRRQPVRHRHSVRPHLPHRCRAAQWELVAEYDGEPNGMKFLERARTADHRLQERPDASATSRAARCGRTWSAATASASRASTTWSSIRSGNLYFTDQGQTGLHDPTGRLYRLRPDGQLDLLLANVPSPNGVALSPDEKVLYLAVTRGNCVWRVPLLATAASPRSASSSRRTARAARTAWPSTSRAA